mmetsp:Transcript_13291/g.17750  ORF Transcript_13291/g.17750 Transcript_13291/m.17750 type:complete len:159 (+) Transcript_13291:94-570(+)
MSEDTPIVPVDPPQGMEKLLRNMGLGVAIGGIYGSIRSAWDVPRTGSDGITLAVDVLPSFKKMWNYVGGGAALLAGVALTYTLSEGLVASVRGEYDYYSTMSGSFMSGAFIGARSLRALRAFSYGVAFAIVGLTAHIAEENLPKHAEYLKHTRMYRVI